MVAVREASAYDASGAVAAEGASVARGAKGRVREVSNAFAGGFRSPHTKPKNPKTFNM